ncbi:MAG: hypothetical protein QOJ62_1551 [Actinomycetota bacterium]|nr:hypothetical protein [Actinomycetota bacterium]
MIDGEYPAPARRVRDGRSWRIGDAAEVAWIAQGTVTGLTIASAIPPIFDAYATTVVPGDAADRDEHDRALLTLLSDQSAGQPWWLGYLDTGADDVVFPDAPMVTLYAGWHYVLVEAGPPQAASWKDPSSWRGALPDVIFPADRSWLVSTLWDDEWRCVGGPTDLVERFQRDARLEARPVSLGDDATPPGHQAR